MDGVCRGGPSRRREPDFLRFVTDHLERSSIGNDDYTLTLDDIETLIIANAFGRTFSKSERKAWQVLYGDNGENCNARHRKNIFKIFVIVVFLGCERLGSPPEPTPLVLERVQLHPLPDLVLQLLQDILDNSGFPERMTADVNNAIDALISQRPNKNSILEYSQCNALLAWSHDNSALDYVHVSITRKLPTAILEARLDKDMVDIACQIMSQAYPLQSATQSYSRNLIKMCTDMIVAAWGSPPTLSLQELTDSSNRFDSDGEPLEMWFGSTVAKISADNSELEVLPSAVIKRRLERGDFGYFPGYGMPDTSASLYRPISVSEMLYLERCGFYVPRSEMGKRYLPNNTGRLLAMYENSAYGGRFSYDGTLFYCYTQSYATYVYDTRDLSNPKFLYRCPFPTAVWTITDAAIDRKNEYLAQCTRSDCILVTKLTSDGSNELLGQELEVPTLYGRHVVYSVDFMPDSSGLLYAKGDGTIGIYDFALSHVTQMHERHEDEVNSARFIDDSAQVVASGSDDSTIRIWDRRDWTKREAGALVGHLEGITSVASRGDGKYIVSNSKDQTAKLWDLRKMISNLRDIRQKTAILCTHFYYQDRDYIPSKVKRHPYDLSVMTYRGHEVLQTAIRANFSPLQSTGGQYIYSGSADGEIYIWKLDGTLVRQLRGSKVLRRAKYLNDKFYPNYQVHSSGPIRLNRAVSNCIRECSWHPHAPVIYAPAICKDHRHDSFYGGKGAIFSFSHDHDYSEIGSTPKGDFDYVNTRESSSLRYLNALYNKRHVA